MELASVSPQELITSIGRIAADGKEIKEIGGDLLVVRAIFRDAHQQGIKVSR